MKIKAIIFDFDGVLFDSHHFHIQACNVALQPLGISLTKQDYFQHYIMLSYQQSFECLLKEKGISFSAMDIQSLIHHKINAYKNLIEKSAFLPSFPGAKNFIEHYQTKMDLAICSDAVKTEIETVLDKLEEGSLKSEFKYILSIEESTIPKPAARGYDLTAEALALPPSHCLAIEDTPEGISAAKQAGMYVIAFTSTYPTSVLSEADFVADKYSVIDDWIQKISS